MCAVNESMYVVTPGDDKSCPDWVSRVSQLLFLLYGVTLEYKENSNVITVI